MWTPWNTMMKQNYSFIDEVEQFPVVTNNQNADKALNTFLQYNMAQNFEQKLKLVKILGESSKDLGIHIERILPTVEAIYQEDDQIKVEFLPQIPLICESLQEHGNYQHILKKIIPILKNFIQSESYEVREAASDAIVKVTNLLNEEDRGNIVLAIVIFLSMDEDNIHNRVQAIQILARIAQILGKNYCEQFSAMTMCSLSMDSEYEVRVEVATNFHMLSGIVGKQFYIQKLFEVLKALAMDGAWQVRKAIALAFPDIVQNSPNEVQQQLSQLYETLLQDKARTVVLSSNYNLCKTIACLKVFNQRLIDSMFQILDKFSDDDIVYQTAFSFPGALFNLQNLGYSIVFPQFQRMYSKLLKFSQVGVKKTLACSLHEIAMILGPQKTEEFLSKVLYQFIKDSNEEIKLSAIENIWKFLRALSQNENRHQYLILLRQLHLESHRKWRVRYNLAKQINHFVDIFEVEEMFSTIFQILYRLVEDPITKIQFKAAKGLAWLLMKLEFSDQKKLQEIVEWLIQFYEHQNFRKRQLFIKTMYYILHTNLFQNYFYQLLYNLCFDQIVNVRVTLALVIQKLNQKQNFNSLKLLEDLYQVLKSDCSKEVKRIVQEIEDNQKNVTEVQGVVRRFQSYDSKHWEQINFNTFQRMPIRGNVMLQNVFYDSEGMLLEDKEFFLAIEEVQQLLDDLISRIE